MRITNKNGAVEVTDFGEINLDLTLDCGQSFRWNKTGDGEWSGIAYGKSIGVRKTKDGLLFFGTDAAEVNSLWAHYFDLTRDYDKYLQVLSADEAVRSAIERYGTIRILNQEPWETMCSFIISACNNIPRIKQIIEKLCACFGTPLPDGTYTFPSAETVARLTEKDLSPIRAGFRAPYIISAARTVNADGGIFDRLRCESETEARRELMRFRGIGKKVADCIMLFSLGCDTVFPMDTHVIAAVASLYPNGLPKCFEVFPGLAQQYVFHAHRTESQRESVRQPSQSGR